MNDTGCKCKVRGGEVDPEEPFEPADVKAVPKEHNLYPPEKCSTHKEAARKFVEHEGKVHTRQAHLAILLQSYDRGHPPQKQSCARQAA